MSFMYTPTGKQVTRIVSMFLLLMTVGQVIMPEAEAMMDFYNEKKIVHSVENLLDIKTENEKVNLVSKVLNLLPPDHFQTLKDVTITGEGGSRGLANSKHLILNSLDMDTKEEFVAVFIHELGHVLDLGRKGKSKVASGFHDMGKSIPSDDPSVKFYSIGWKDEDIRLPGTLPKDFVSGYAMYNMFEDFAETYAFYVLHGVRFQDLLEKSQKLVQKYELLKKDLFKGQTYDFYKENTVYSNEVFDVTLLVYNLDRLIVQSEEEKAKRKLAARTRSKRRAKYRLKFRTRVQRMMRGRGRRA